MSGAAFATVRGALLTTLALALHAAEAAFPLPLPVPGIRLGLANSVNVWAVYHLPPVQALLVLLARVFLAALLGGSGAALAFSLCGGLLSLTGMLALRRARLGMRLCSICGGVLHNLGQLVAAVYLAGSPALWGYLPFLLAAGAVCGALTGEAARLVSPRLKIGRRQH